MRQFFLLLYLQLIRRLRLSSKSYLQWQFFVLLMVRLDLINIIVLKNIYCSHKVSDTVIYRCLKNLFKFYCVLHDIEPYLIFLSSVST